jgi:hypothetical protein
VPIRTDESSALCTFQVPCNALLPYNRLQKLLSAIPEVMLLPSSVMK